MTQPLATVEYRRYSPRPNRCPSCSKSARKQDTTCMACGAPLIDPDDADSLRNQAAANERYMSHHGLVRSFLLVDPLTSARTTKLADRPEGGKLLELVTSGQVRHVVVQRLDRIFRSTVDGILCDELFREHDCTLHLADEGGCSIKTDSAVGRMLFRARLNFAEFEPDVIGERTSTGLQRRVESGQVAGFCLSSRAGPPFGKQLDGNCLIDHPEEQQILSLIRDHSTLTPVALMEKLNADGIPYRGKRWTSRDVRRVRDRLAG